MIKEAIKQYQSSRNFDHFDPKCVLFDMDGVLYDSMRNHAAAWQEAMAQFDIHFTAADSYATEGARGVDTIRHFVRKQQGREIDEAEAQRMYDVKADLFHRMPTAEIFPGVLDIMQKIQSSGLTIGVVTGSGQRPLIKRLLSDFQGFSLRMRRSACVLVQPPTSSQWASIAVRCPILLSLTTERMLFFSA